jgi:hypothetical protein
MAAKPLSRVICVASIWALEQPPQPMVARSAAVEIGGQDLKQASLPEMRMNLG